MHHSILGVIANGAVTGGRIANGVGKQVSNIAPVLTRLIDAGFVVRHEDPLRAQRALYALTDPFLQLHYAVLDPRALGSRAADAKLLLFGPRMSAELVAETRGRADVQLVDFERLYEGE